MDIVNITFIAIVTAQVFLLLKIRQNSKDEKNRLNYLQTESEMFFDFLALNEKFNQEVYRNYRNFQYKVLMPYFELINENNFNSVKKEFDFEVNRLANDLKLASEQLNAQRYLRYSPSPNQLLGS